MLSTSAIWYAKLKFICWEKANMCVINTSVILGWSLEILYNLVTAACLHGLSNLLNGQLQSFAEKAAN